MGNYMGASYKLVEIYMEGLEFTKLMVEIYKDGCKLVGIYMEGYKLVEIYMEGYKLVEIYMEGYKLVEIYIWVGIY